MRQTVPAVQDERPTDMMDDLRRNRKNNKDYLG